METTMTVGTSAMSVEQDLSKQAEDLELRIEACEITNDLSFQAAGELTKQVKRMQKAIKEYWEPLRISTKTAYDNVLAKKKAMTDPMDRAESILKRKIAAYTAEQRRKAEEEAERIRKAAQEEMERQLAAAAELEASGDDIGAQYAMANAETYESFAQTVVAQPQPMKAQGVTVTKTWKIKSIDPTKVPVIFNGVELRPVDEKAVLRLVKSSKGQIAIPGVEIEETSTVSVRA